MNVLLSLRRKKVVLFVPSSEKKENKAIPSFKHCFVHGNIAGLFAVNAALASVSSQFQIQLSVFCSQFQIQFSAFCSQFQIQLSAFCHGLQQTLGCADGCASPVEHLYLSPPKSHEALHQWNHEICYSFAPTLVSSDSWVANHLNHLARSHYISKIYTNHLNRHTYVSQLYHVFAWTKILFGNSASPMAVPFTML